ncbi:MAG: hypothetical protein M1827_006442 [Pycnora praestabilis]|nr:MAG: hypothetical protein M1827_006442 [Pycnora praestabilis]
MEGSPLPEGATRAAFPQTPDEFDADPRVSFSKLDSKWILEDDDGGEFEYDEALKRWVPVLDDALLEQQRKAYAVAGVDESEPAVLPKKRKNVYTNGEEDNGNGKAKKPKASEARERKNTAVYVTNLPFDITSDEIHSVFSKCGVIAEEIDRGKPRIKLYTNDDGKFKGDALIVYFRAESVPLAVQMLDDTDFRFGVAGEKGKMRVQAADFSYKNQQEAPTKTSMKDKKKIIKKTQKLNNKLADWDDDDPSAIQDTSSRWDKDDPAAILDIKEDIREECAKLGEVTNVVLFDKETDGVASVRYANAEAAKACVRVMDGRFFAGTQVEAYISEGNEKFRKSSEKKLGTEEEGEGGEGGDDDESKRLDKFGTWLEDEAKED